jgi:Tol biopolymer transport system component
MFVAKADGTALTDLTDTTGGYAWSPDGAKIVCTAGDVFVMNPDGSGKTALMTVGAATLPEWSSTARRIVFQSAGDIWVMGADGSGQTKVANGVNYSWQPMPH